MKLFALIAINVALLGCVSVKKQETPAYIAPAPVEETSTTVISE